MASKSKTALWGSFSIFSGSLGRQILQTVVMLILARILTPDDFGAVAIVISAISIFQVFAELGVSVALVQKKEITDLDKDSGFSLTLLFTAVNVLLIWVLAGWAARFFEAPVLAGLFKVAALSYLFRGLFSLFRSLLLRSLKFKILAGLEFVAALMAGVLDVVLAALGYGAYAIVWGRVLEAFLLLVAAAVVVRYIPRSLGSVANMVALFRFGIWVSLYRLVLLGSNQFDKFIIGKVMPMANLGGFYLAQRITYLVPELILGAVDQVMLPIYSRMQDDRPGMVEGYWKGLQYSLMLVFPFSALLIVLSTPIVTVFLGDKWTGADRIIQVLSIYAISLGMGGGGLGSMFYAIGKPKYLSIFSLFRLITLPLGIIIGSKWGIVGVAWGIAAFGVVHRVFVQSIMAHVFQLKIKRWLQTVVPPLLAAVVVGGLGYGVQHLFTVEGFWESVALLLSTTMLMVAVYLFLIAKLLPEPLQFILGELRSKMSRR
jgi:O-antigen/teichoic acid export membrane protein